MIIAFQICALAAQAVAAPDPQALRDTVRRSMEPSIAAQRASVARQAGSAIRGAASTAVTAVAAPAEADCAPLEDTEFAAMVDIAARRESLEPALLRGVARQESGLRPCAVSPKGAMGLMQLMPETARELGVDDPFDPAQSIDGGARLLRKYLDAYGSLPLALGAYNAGPGRVEQAGGVPRIPETVDYVRRILGALPRAVVPK